MTRSTRQVLAFLAFVILAAPATAQTSWFQGFEVDTSGWTGASRVPSGTHSIPSAAGAFHAEVARGSGAYTNWGGYSATPGCTGVCPGPFPAYGYITAIDIYLDMGLTVPNDTRFDFTSAINTPAGNHRRDFIFNGGFYNDTDSTGTGPRFVFSTSNNAPGWPKNPARSPFAITTTGWYTLMNRFYDNGSGVLAVDLVILNAAGTVLNTWTLSDPTDIIGSTVGGNRYGWFATNQFPFLAIDNSRRESILLNPVLVGRFANLGVPGDNQLINLTSVNGTPPPGSPAGTGNICVNVYAYDEAEEMIACCACEVTPHGLKTLSIKNHILTQTITPGTPASISVTLYATTKGQNDTCNPGDPTANGAAGSLDLRAWGTTVRQGTPAGVYQVVEESFLSGSKAAALANDIRYCNMIKAYASGYGICKGCELGAFGGSKK